MKWLVTSIPNYTLRVKVITGHPGGTACTKLSVLLNFNRRHCLRWFNAFIDSKYLSCSNNILIEPYRALSFQVVPTPYSWHINCFHGNSLVVSTPISLSPKLGGGQHFIYTATSTNDSKYNGNHLHLWWSLIIFILSIDFGLISIVITFQ
jgi:hypothetical protein